MAVKNGNKNSEYLPQRREGKKNIVSELGVFAPLRQEYPNLKTFTSRAFAVKKSFGG